MKIFFHSHADDKTSEIVRTAMRRSFTSSAIESKNIESHTYLAVIIAPNKSDIPLLNAIMHQGGKALLLGRPSSEVAELLQMTLLGGIEPIIGTDAAPSAEGQPFTQSSGKVVYNTDNALAAQAIFNQRPFTRFDFTQEWNNLGFGRITTSNDPWSISCLATCNGNALANLVIDGKDSGPYSVLRDSAQGSLLWYNRPVGPVDSVEWNIIEKFFCDYRADEGLPCIPCLSEVPFGKNVIVTMRIDCDEAIYSAHSLFEFYKSINLPLSLAVKTSLPIGEQEFSFFDEIYENGGALLSHSHTHAKNWGRNAEEAYTDAELSRRWFEKNLAQFSPIQYAVSPFHTNRSWSLNALAHLGFKGCIGGIIHNDPEYLIARPGVVPFVSENIISFTQQCMLHGDCYAMQGYNMNVAKQNFRTHYAARSSFGFLDHAFSKRYSYGWADALQRMQAHKELIEYIEGFEGVLWANPVTCMQYFSSLSQSTLQLDVSGEKVSLRNWQGHSWQPAVRFKNKIIPVG